VQLTGRHHRSRSTEYDLSVGSDFPDARSRRKPTPAPRRRRRAPLRDTAHERHRWPRGGPPATPRAKTGRAPVPHPIRSRGQTSVSNRNITVNCSNIGVSSVKAATAGLPGVHLLHPVMRQPRIQAHRDVTQSPARARQTAALNWGQIPFQSATATRRVPPTPRDTAPGSGWVPARERSQRIAISCCTCLDLWRFNLNDHAKADCGHP
jgi:hypothetical protein